MKSSPDRLKDVILIVIDIVLAIVVVILLNHFNVQLTVAQDIMVGVLLTMSFLMAEIFWTVSAIEDREREEENLWLIQHPFENTLHNIREHYRSIAQRFYGDHDLFKDHFERSFEEIEEIIKGAAIHNELKVVDYHFHNTDLVLAAFRGDATQILRYVWVIETGEDLFEEKWKHYCTQIEDAVRDGEIKEVRALLVLKPGLRADHPIVKKLAGYYEFSRGFSYKLIDEERYLNQKTDSRLSSEYIDFGIYGQRYIYLTISYDKVIAGKWSKARDIIDRYTQFFDVVWNSSSASTLPKNSASRATLADLFALKW